MIDLSSQEHSTTSKCVTDKRKQRIKMPMSSIHKTHQLLNNIKRVKSFFIIEWSFEMPNFIIYSFIQLFIHDVRNYCEGMNVWNYKPMEESIFQCFKSPNSSSIICKYCLTLVFSYGFEKVIIFLIRIKINAYFLD